MTPPKYMGRTVNQWKTTAIWVLLGATISGGGVWGAAKMAGQTIGLPLSGASPTTIHRHVDYEGKLERVKDKQIEIGTKQDMLLKRQDSMDDKLDNILREVRRP